ncbi:hypothetical protein [Spiroplasma endosymbiont of Virgichneumon dumeticola]|uniref:hypothetical protein n=1 Tax=Spiroplasma endosymbiont of Virgichneumon dumeticola TaxID=3139323 RepID=UPI0035C8C542
MKKLLKLFSIIALGATPVMSVVYCGSKDNTEVRMNEQVAKNLDLLDGDGHGLQSATLTSSGEKIEWSIPASVPTTSIKANQLLETPGTNSEAKDDASYDFITKTLNVQPLTGTKNFDKDVLADIEGQITNINPTLKLVAGNGYHVLGGNFSFQFMKKSDSTVLGPKYSIALKRDNTTDVVTTVLQRIIPLLVATDTDVETNPNIKLRMVKQFLLRCC